MKDVVKYVKLALEDAYTKALTNIIPIDADKIRWIIFSDLHKGQGDGANDFKKCKSIYHAALGYYLNAGYTLFLLGDIEDLWECFPSKVINHYNDTLLLEKRFLESNPDRYFRIFGNHDDLWRNSNKMQKHLQFYINKNSLDEGIAFKVKINNKERTIFLTHGHQGSLANDRISWFSRLIVRFIWRNIQRITRIPSSTPATSFEIRSQHEKAIYEWISEKSGTLLICGDTHHPIFASEIHEETIIAEIKHLEDKLIKEIDPNSKKILQEEICNHNADLEWVRSKSKREIENWVLEKKKSKPCYFNSGTCSFADGDITGIEIADNKIRLVRWPDDLNNPRKKILREAELGNIFSQC